MSLLCVLAVVEGDSAGLSLDVPEGFAANLYARGIPGAHGLAVLDDGTLTLQGRARNDRFEISPPTPDGPVTVMRVATELVVPDAAAGWGVALKLESGEGIPLSPRTLALARSLAGQSHSDVALAPDGTLFVADSQSGAVWHVSRTAL